MDTEKEKRERFLRIASNRTNRIVDDFRLLGNCSNRNNYSYTKEEVNEMFREIERSLARCKEQYSDKNHSVDRFYFSTMKEETDK